MWKSLVRASYTFYVQLFARRSCATLIVFFDFSNRYLPLKCAHALRKRRCVKHKPIPVSDLKGCVFFGSLPLKHDIDTLLGNNQEEIPEKATHPSYLLEHLEQS
jgi:hypothetical protein